MSWSPIRFILKFYEHDATAATQFLATFLTKVYSELDMNSDYLRPKKNKKTSFGNVRPSPSLIMFESFQKDLYIHGSSLVNDTFIHSNCAEIVREHSLISKLKKHEKQKAKA